MSIIKSSLICLLFSIIFFAFFISCSDRKEANIRDYQNKLSYYLEKLKEDPNNCLYNQQVATYYSFIGKYDDSISFYEKVVKVCPSDLNSIFQLGVTHLLNGNKDDAFSYMDEAIEKAKKIKDTEFVTIFENEKKWWMDHIQKQ